jgi:hypothetical protein
MAQELTLLLAEDGADAERLDTLTRHLRRELDELDVERVAPLSSGEAPEGSRAIEVAAVGALLVTLGNSAQALGKVVGAIRDWLGRTPGPVRTVRLELGGDVLELSQASAAEQDRLVELFVTRHAQQAGNAGWPDAAKP